MVFGKIARMALALSILGAGGALALGDRRQPLPPNPPPLPLPLPLPLPTSPKPGPISALFTETFEDGEVAGKWVKTGTDVSKLAVTTERARAGTKSMKFDFAKSDWRDAGAGRRLMIRPTQIHNATIDQDIWYGFSVYMEGDWTEQPQTSGLLIWQLHGGYGGPAQFNPPMGIYLERGELQVSVTAAEASFDCTRRGPERRMLTVIPLADILNTWQDYVLKVKFAYTAGTIDVWKNGVHITQYAGPTLYRCNVQTTEIGPYSGIGPYKWAWGTTPSRLNRLVMYVDEFRIGDDKADCAAVKPTGSAPCAP